LSHNGKVLPHAAPIVGAQFRRTPEAWQRDGKEDDIFSRLSKPLHQSNEISGAKHLRDHIGILQYLLTET
jgi:hypothetical protein